MTGTSWLAAIGSDALRGGRGRQRRERQELALNVGAQPIGFLFLAVGRADGERLVGRSAAVDGGAQETARLGPFAAVKGRDAGVQELFGVTLALGDGAARPLDVGASAGMAAIEEQRARPDVDRLLVLRGEV